MAENRNFRATDYCFSFVTLNLITPNACKPEVTSYCSAHSHVFILLAQDRAGIYFTFDLYVFSVGEAKFLA